MENLLLNLEEHKILVCHRKVLERQFSVKISIPQFQSSSGGDIIFATVHGTENGISDVKKFLKEKCENDVLVLSGDDSDQLPQDEIPIITLSDSDTEISNLLIENKPNEQPQQKKRKRLIADIDLTNSPQVQGKGNDCEVSSTTEEPVAKRMKNGFINSERYIPLCSVNAESSSLRSNLTIGNNIRSKKSRRGKCRTVKRRSKICQKNRGRECIAVAEFIPISSGFASNNRPLLDENSLPARKPVSRDPKLLRPIVIDGSNVAREHGKADNTFSCKGIKLSIEYFLQRGHTQVTAFVPMFRRHKQNGIIPNKDEELLEELARSGHVVFTPSRRVNRKLICSYDDRFIVELASKNGGVILSNDNFKDIMEESEAFKDTIEKRLLMFCFVGDLLMIPQDPLGRSGPCLDEYLSFPAENNLISV